MEKFKIFITCVFGIGLVFLAGFSIEALLEHNYVSLLFFVALFVFVCALIYDIWFESKKEKEREKLYQRKIMALGYATKNKQGTKEEFVKDCGEDMYNHCLLKGIIHEPLNCKPDNIRWEATHHAFCLLEKLCSKD